MKNPILSVLLLSGISLNSIAQFDSLQRYLVKPIVESVNLSTDSFVSIPPYIGDIPPYIIEPWIIPYPYEPYPYIDWGTVSLYYVVVPTCGETFHDNGQMASKIECKDSVLHGKATYWNEKGQKTSESFYLNGLLDGTSKSWNKQGIKTYESNYLKGKLHGKVTYWNESGHKTNEYTYAYNRIYKEKVYEGHSKIESVEHFMYDEDGEKQLHGICTYYMHDGKFVKRYVNGLEHGLYEEYHNGVKTEEKIFKDGNLIDDKAWDNNGNFIYQGTYTNDGDLVRLEQWDANGTVTKQNFYENKKPCGTWLTYDPITDYKTLTYYSENGQILKQDCFKQLILTQRHLYNKGIKTDIINYHSNGIKAEHRKVNFDGTTNYQAWTKFNYQTENTTWRNNKLIGDGMYHLKDTMYLYYEATELNESPIKRFVILHKDTLRQEYVVNSSLNRHQILQSNYYKPNSNGVYTKSGVWSYYEGNTISHALTYVDNELTGRVVFYKADLILKVNEIGHYQKGVKHGQWTLLTDSTKEEWNYINGEMNGDYYEFNSNADTLVAAHYKNNSLDGEYVAYNPNGSVALKGFYLDGYKTGFWAYFNTVGTALESGEYEHDKHVGKWVEWYFNEKGKLKKRKVNYDKLALG